MKQFALLALLTIILWGCSTPTIPSDKLQVPQTALDAFAAKFPTAKKVSWEQESTNEYEASFKEGGKKMSANFDSNGDWLETETSIKAVDLPQAVKDSIAVSFAGFEIEEAETVEQPEQALVYEVELENEQTDEELEAVYDANGNLLSSENEEDD